MKKQDSGFGIQDSVAGRGVLYPESGILNPESCVLDPVYLERVRWRCRRGLLELDIVLGRFIEQRYTVMNNEQRLVFDELLDLPDTELWDLITGKKEPTHAHLCLVLGWLQEV
jgi:antitoxin CptB